VLCERDDEFERKKNRGSIKDSGFKL
jgi:hypothetical protein